MAGQEEALPPGRDSGVDRLEAAISVKHALHLVEVQPGAKPVGPERPNGYYSFPQRPVGPGYRDLQAGLWDEAGDLLRSAQPSP